MPSASASTPCGTWRPARTGSSTWRSGPATTRPTRRWRRTGGSSIARVTAREVHHVGVAVDDLDAAIGTYGQLLGGEVEHRDTVESQGVEAAAVRVGEGRVELLRPLGADT